MITICISILPEVLLILWKVAVMFRPLRWAMKYAKSHLRRLSNEANAICVAPENIQIINRRIVTDMQHYTLLQYLIKLMKLTGAEDG
jgi:hypothetical protein